MRRRAAALLIELAWLQLVAVFVLASFTFGIVAIVPAVINRAAA